MTENGPPGLLEAFGAYEAALMADDVVTLDCFFAPGPETLRVDSSGLLVGHRAISEFRAKRGGAAPREIVEIHVRTVDDDHALIVAVSEFAPGRRGLQTQSWTRFTDGWKIVAAHITPPNVPAPPRTARIHLISTLVLTFATGLADAVGYLGLDRVFTGNMTGNVVIFGMALTGTADLPLLGPGLALVGFLSGAAIAGRALRSADAAWGWITSALLAAVAAVMVALGGVLFAAGPHPSHAVMVAVTTGAAAAMGMQAAVARVVAVTDVTTVVVTSTLTALAADSAFGSGKGRGSGRRLAAVLVLLLGAGVGALMLRWSLGLGLVVVGALVAGCTGAGEVHRRRTR